MTTMTEPPVTDNERGPDESCDALDAAAAATEASDAA